MVRLLPGQGHTLALVPWDGFLDSLYEMCPSRFVGSMLMVYGLVGV